MELKDILKCGICQELIKLPASLDCGHSFCRECIYKKWQDDGSKNRKFLSNKVFIIYKLDFSKRSEKTVRIRSLICPDCQKVANFTESSNWMIRSNFLFVFHMSDKKL